MQRIAPFSFSTNHLMEGPEPPWALRLMAGGAVVFVLAALAMSYHLLQALVFQAVLGWTPPPWVHIPLFPLFAGGLALLFSIWHGVRERALARFGPNAFDTASLRLAAHLSQNPLAGRNTALCTPTTWCVRWKTDVYGTYAKGPFVESVEVFDDRNALLFRLHPWKEAHGDPTLLALLQLPWPEGRPHRFFRPPTVVGRLPAITTAHHTLAVARHAHGLPAS